MYRQHVHKYYWVSFTPIRITGDELAEGNIVNSSKKNSDK